MSIENDLALMAASVYDANDRNALPELADWSRSPYRYGPYGLQYRVFTNRQDANDVVIAFTGTEGVSPADWTTNVIAASGVPLESQLTAAALVYAQVRRAHADPDNVNITFTGHSLGGGLASVMVVWFNEPAVVFAPAPFQNSVLGPLSSALTSMVRARLQRAFGEDGAGWLSYSAGDFASREGNVESYYVLDEILHRAPIGTFPRIEGTALPVDIGETPTARVGPPPSRPTRGCDLRCRL
jgi:hypothetical protein